MLIGKNDLQVGQWVQFLPPSEKQSANISSMFFKVIDREDLITAFVSDECRCWLIGTDGKQYDYIPRISELFNSESKSIKLEWGYQVKVVSDKDVGEKAEEINKLAKEKARNLTSDKSLILKMTIISGLMKTTKP